MNITPIRHFALLGILLLLWGIPVSTTRAGVRETSPAQVDEAALASIFSGFESLQYSVSWSGGVKIGDLLLTVQPEPSRKDAFRINARVKSAGPLELIYPIDDTFDCYVRGRMKLPYEYAVLQREGFGRETRRLTRYDQRLLYVLYQKNNEPEERFTLAGTVYNEFASFFITRALQFHAGEEVVVPTFVDKKRHEVMVAFLGREKRNTLFGEKETLKIMPKMQFKGMYDKKGDTVFWLTDDRCRVPVEIHSKIVVGSLVAELVGYANPACGLLEQVSTRPAQ